MSPGSNAKSGNWQLQLWGKHQYWKPHPYHFTEETVFAYIVSHFLSGWEVTGLWDGLIEFHAPPEGVWEDTHHRFIRVK